MNFQDVLEFFQNLWNNAFIKTIISTLIFIVIWWFVSIVIKGLKKRAMKKADEKLLVSVIFTFVLWSVRVVIILAYASVVGIDTAGLAALVASAGVAIGLALQGSLSNLAGGIVLAVTRPFRQGDYIEATGVSGTVEDIKLFYTQLCTPDNKLIMIPNGSLANDVIINYSTKDIRRVDLVFSISYDDNIDKAIELITNVCKKHMLILQDKTIFVKEAVHGTSSVDISTKVWVNNKDYWTVHFDLISQVHKVFNENKITIPYQQIDIHTK